ncbi:MAG: ABC transporter permease [Candidatus Altiarchaeota archaeon]
MNIYKLVLRNMIRRRSRFVFTLLGIVVGIASLVALLSISGGLEQEINKQAGSIGANLIVTPKGWCAYEQISVLLGESVPEQIDNSDVEKISKIEGIVIAPFLTEAMAIKNNPVTVIGIIPSQMNFFKGWKVGEGNYLKDNDTFVALIGVSIADKFELNVGDEIKIRGKVFRIKGILTETGTKDDVSVFIPLKIAQEVYEIKDKVSFIAVKVDDVSKLDYYSTKIKDVANVDVTSDKQLVASVLSIVSTVKNSMQIIATVAILTACFGIMNTMMTAVYERKREIGILKSVGGRNFSIFKIFVLEAVVLGLAGGILGAVIGFLATYISAPYMSSNEFMAFVGSSSQSSNVFDPTIFVITLFFSLSISIISGLYPAWRASKLTPLEAMRYE